MATAGYSGTPLAKKLGIKPGFLLKLINEPAHYFELFSDMPGDIVVSKATKDIDFIHCFTATLSDLEKQIPKLRKQIKPNGTIWISWYKKSAKIPTDVTEDLIRDIALANGLVDVKVCAVDEQWSGLKLVIPVKDR